MGVPPNLVTTATYREQRNVIEYAAVMYILSSRAVVKQDWPVASELVPGGMHFPFCLQRARYDHPIRQKVHGRISGKRLRVVGFRNNRVAIK